MLFLGPDKCECGYDFKDLRERLGLDEPRERYGIAHYQCPCKRWYEVDGLCGSGAIGLLPIKINEVYGPIAFPIDEGQLMEEPQRPRLTEKLMEDAIARDPERYLERGLSLLERQYRVGDYIFDLMFQDRHGARLIVELQRGTLDRNHTYKILDYYDEYKRRNPGEFVELMIIANRIPSERRERLYSHGIEFKEIPESRFLIFGSRTDTAASVVESAVEDEKEMVPESWDETALARIEEWLRQFVHNSSVGEIFEIGKLARQSRSIGHILPLENIGGFRHLLEKLTFEGYVEIEGKKHFRVTKNK
jgi:hypothetical protein